MTEKPIEYDLKLIDGLLQILIDFIKSQEVKEWTEIQKFGHYSPIYTYEFAKAQHGIIQLIYKLGYHKHGDIDCTQCEQKGFL